MSKAKGVFECSRVTPSLGCSASSLIEPVALLHKNPNFLHLGDSAEAIPGLNLKNVNRVGLI
jgi:hypothetical protein